MNMIDRVDCDEGSQDEFDLQDHRRHHHPAPSLPPPPPPNKVAAALSEPKNTIATATAPSEPKNTITTATATAKRTQNMDTRCCYGVRNGAGGYTGIRNDAYTGARNGSYNRNADGGYNKIGNDKPMSGFDRKSGSKANEIKHGNNVENRPVKNNLKNGRVVKNSDGFAKSVGNRFEILNEEVEEIMNEGNQQTNSKPLSNKFKGKTVLSEIINAFGRQSSQPGKGNEKITKKLEKGVKRVPLQESASFSKGSMGSKSNLQGQQSTITVKEGEEHNSVSVLCQLHKEVHQFDIKEMEVAAS
ncbi:hypothetical protein LWI28_024054 [Acer negundo]|uniref:Uncharacterized protein n=1 Tax=Acer negundo TaxID=4023 RepID=A0AAD5IK73_ACENE|nr:hypothetical protein LWI28_024054 [Acer negundo]